jgi:hypothetical protein
VPEQLVGPVDEVNVQRRLLDESIIIGPAQAGRDR